MGIESRIEDFFSQVHFFKLAYGTILKRAPCPLLHSSFSFVDNVVWCVVLWQHLRIANNKHSQAMYPAEAHKHIDTLSLGR